jgi:hypothetical protein
VRLNLIQRGGDTGACVLCDAGLMVRVVVHGRWRPMVRAEGCGAAAAGRRQVRDALGCAGLHAHYDRRGPLWECVLRIVHERGIASNGG